MEAYEREHLLIIRSPLSGSNSRQGASVNEAANVVTYDETLFENPEFEHHEATSNIQLFFDLFFVANLLSFTNAHEINSLPRLSSYIGFFAVLWMTWCQVTLYDVRFSTDSVFERVAHACHFGVMVGLAIIGPEFDDPSSTRWPVMQELSLILMGGRAVLLCQYGTTLYFVWRYRASRKPIIAIMITLSVAIILYLGISFAFYLQTTKTAYAAWYMIGVFEVFSNLVIAKWSDAISFQNTHLVERMTSLTLIIFGEGIIGLCKTIAKIETLDFAFSPAAIGGIISGTLIIYLLYQLYFDNVRLEPFDSLRQQIWAGLHFPFHMALVLLMEGINQVFVWSHIVEDLNIEINKVINIPANATAEETFTTVDGIVNYVFNHFPSTADLYQQTQTALAEFAPTSNATQDEQNVAGVTIFTDLCQIIFEGFGWAVPNTDANLPQTGNLEERVTLFTEQYYYVFSISFAYFCISGGVVLISIGLFTYLSYSGEAHHRGGSSRFLGIIAHILIGIGLALFSTAVLTRASTILGSTPWTLPLLLFLLLILLIISNIPARGGRAQNVSQEEK